MPGEGSELALSALGAVVWWVSVQNEMTLLYLQRCFRQIRAIAGIPRCIQKRPPEKRRKGHFNPLLLEGCMQA